MRIDRLLAVLLLLQRRGQVTAAEVAEEMEVSQRTARRDLEALLMAGVPVYSVQGRGGGWRLVGGARTDLTGLTADEARALFLVAGPAAEATPAVKAALRKLVQALPDPFRTPAEVAASALVVDPRHWNANWPDRELPRFLEAIQGAAISGVQMRLGYTDRLRIGDTSVDGRVAVTIRGHNEYALAGELAGLVEWLEITEPAGVRDRLGSIGTALVDMYG